MEPTVQRLISDDYKNVRELGRHREGRLSCHVEEGSTWPPPARRPQVTRERERKLIFINLPLSEERSGKGGTKGEGRGGIGGGVEIRLFFRRGNG